MTRHSVHPMHRFKSSKVQAFKFVLLISLITVELLNPLNLEPVFGQVPFYQGRTVRIFVGYLAGDSHDLVARAYARTLGKYLPGNPEIIVQNMPGAGGFGSWPVVSTPGLPSDRASILRNAYIKTLKDPDFLDEAKKRGWDLRPVSGEELQALAKEVIDQPPEVIEWLKKLLATK